MSELIATMKQELQSSWENELKKTNLWQALLGGNFSREHYASYLLETLFYTKRSALIQASAVAHFQVANRHLVRPFLKHALEEEGHYKLCLNDLRALGYSEECVSKIQPLPATEGYLGFIFNRIMFVNPLSYLGYLYNLEYMAVHIGPVAVKLIIESTGLNDMKHHSFLRVHADEDIDHVAELETLLASVASQNHSEIMYVAKTAASLYAAMISASFSNPRKRA